MEQLEGEIVCRHCGRHLQALRVPRCNWCGAQIPAEDFAAIAAQSQYVMSLPTPPPLPPVTSYLQRDEWGQGGGLNPIQRLNWQTAGWPGGWGQRLRVGAIVMVGLAAAMKIIFHLYVVWQLHRVMQTLPH